MAFAQWMAGWPGRLLRIVAGLALVALGLGAVDGVWSIVLVLVGVVPIAAGALNICLVAPLIGAPFRGRDAVGD